jgi:uncharacterized protein YdeI (YjbR/CyaY-like superfamily)
MRGRPKPLHFADRRAWCAWLAAHHATEAQVWLLYYKKHTGKPTIPYDHAVEEALCYGWIDSTVRRIDGETHMQRFTPRKPRSVWSATNKRRALALIRKKRMTAAGREKISAAKASGAWQAATQPRRPPSMPADLAAELEANARSRERFAAFAPSYRTQYIWWVTSAKRPETRRRRIAEVVRRSLANEKPG